MKRVIILGSTGSIGRNTLKVIASLNQGKALFKVVGLSAHSNLGVLSSQVKRLLPKWVCLTDSQAAKEAKKRLPASCRILSGKKGPLI